MKISKLPEMVSFSTPWSISPTPDTDCIQSWPMDFPATVLVVRLAHSSPASRHSLQLQAASQAEHLSQPCLLNSLGRFIYRVGPALMMNDGPTHSLYLSPARSNCGSCRGYPTIFLL